MRPTRASVAALVLVGVLALSWSSAGADPAGVEEPGPIVPPEEASPPVAWGAVLRDLSLELDTTGRWRDSGVFSLELGGLIAYRGFFVGAGYQVPAPWDLAGWAVEATAVSLRGGWRPTVYNEKHYAAYARVALAAEWISLRRADLPAKTAADGWDLGLEGALSVVRRLPASAELGVRAGLTWFPSGTEVQISGGPASRLNRISVALGVFLSLDLASLSSSGRDR